MNEENQFYVLTDDGINIVDTNVRHLITLRHDGNIHEAPDMKIGYAGAGPNELAANMLFLMNVDEKVCSRLASKFRNEVIDIKMNRDGNRYSIDKSVINEWLSTKNITAYEFP